MKEGWRKGRGSNKNTEVKVKRSERQTYLFDSLIIRPKGAAAAIRRKKGGGRNK